MQRTWCVVLAGVVAGGGTAFAERDRGAADGDISNFVGWRTDGTGRSPAASPPTQWSAEKNVLWKTELPGRSFASPILVGDRLFVLSEPAELLCLAADDGRVLWTRSNTWVDLFGPERGQQIEADLAQARQLESQIKKLQQDLVYSRKAETADQDERKRTEWETRIEELQDEVARLTAYPDPRRGPLANSRSTPASDGRHVYAVFGNGIVSCHTLDGKRRWMQFLEPPSLGFGHSTSPLLADGRLIVHLHDMVALDPLTGNEIWRLPLRPRYGSPVLARIAGQELIVSPAGAVVRAADGALLAEGLFNLAESSPIVQQDVVFVAEKNQTKTQAVRLRPRDDALDVERLWQADVPNQRRFASLMYHDGLLYSFAANILETLDAETGKLVSRRRLPLSGRSYPSPAMAGGLLFVSTDDGVTVVAEPGRNYALISRNELEPFGNCLVFNGTRLYVRTMQHLWCIGE